MKKMLLATAAVVALTGASQAQDLTVSGFLEFEGIYGANYDSFALLHLIALGDDEFVAPTEAVRDLDFGVDGRLNFDYANSTKSGLEYGAHFELDLYQSDGEDYYGSVEPVAESSIPPWISA